MSAFTVARDSLANIAATIRDFESKTAPALTKYTKQAQIMGRVYIEDSIAADDIAIPLMGVLNQMYVSYVITALHLNTFCVGGRTIRQRLELVATEDIKDVEADITDSFGGKPIKSFEDNPNTYTKKDYDPNTMGFGRSSGRETVVNLDPDSQRLVCGRLIEFSFNAPSNSVGGTSTVNAYIYVQLVPYILEQAVASGFLHVNFAPSLKYRWKQLRAGEIRFLKDFILARDLIARQADALKKDRTGVLLEMMTRQRNALFKWAGSLLEILPERHNLANSILILDSNTFKQACNATKVDFNSNIGRQKFFAKTFTMILVVVDPMYGTIEMYFNGINAKGTYTFDMVNKVGTKSKDSFDLKQVMQAFSQGMTPKF